MKISAIKKVLTRAKQVVIYADGEAQWVGTEEACYKVDGACVKVEGTAIGVESVSGLFDISGEKLAAMNVYGVEMEKGGLMPDANCMPEEVEELMPVWCGRIYKPICVSGQLFVLDGEKLKAAQCGRDDLYLVMRRSAKGDPLILAGDGLRITGIIRPESMSTAEMVMDQARRLMRMTIGAVYRDGKSQISVSEVMEDDGAD